MARTVMQRLQNKVDRRNRAIVEVDSKEAIDMIGRTMRVLSGDKLEDFLQGPAHDYFEDEIVQRFAHQGDRKSGHWPDLAASTNRIRRALGFPEDEVNIRTEELFATVTEDADYYIMGDSAASMMLPGSAATGVVAEKLRTAQLGKQTNPMFPGAVTPPRPVLAVDEDDMEALLERLSRWITWELVGSFL